MKTLLLKNPKTKLKSWKLAVNELIDQAELWAQKENWSTFRENKEIQESRIGIYQLPILRVRFPNGEVWLDPIGLDIVGAEGRVDLQSWPSLNRIKLMRRNKKWSILTDSNVPLRQSWSRKVFLDLLNDLTAPNP